MTTFYVLSDYGLEEIFNSFGEAEKWIENRECPDDYWISTDDGGWGGSDDLSNECACDLTGYCSGTSCPYYHKCKC